MGEVVAFGGFARFFYFMITGQIFTLWFSLSLYVHFRVRWVCNSTFDDVNSCVCEEN